MNSRSTRYHIEITRKDGSSEVIQSNSRRIDALKRAAFVAMDRQGWPSVVGVKVLDTMPQMIDGQFINVVFASNR
jgi:hypothetical protein